LGTKAACVSMCGGTVWFKINGCVLSVFMLVCRCVCMRVCMYAFACAYVCLCVCACVLHHGQQHPCLNVR